MLESPCWLARGISVPSGCLRWFYTCVPMSMSMSTCGSSESLPRVVPRHHAAVIVLTSSLARLRPPSTCIHRGWACGARRLLRRDLGALSLVPHELSVPHCKAEHRAHDDESELILLEDWVEHLTRREMGSSSARGRERGGTATGGGGARGGKGSYGRKQREG